MIILNQLSIAAPCQRLRLAGIFTPLPVCNSKAVFSSSYYPLTTSINQSE